jgi:hypothetical protein
MNTTTFPRLAVAVGMALACAGAQAAEAYAAIGLPGLVIGFAQPVNDRVSLRADLGTLGSRDVDGDHEGIDYRGDVHYHRLGLFGDWFVAGGGFRLTGGVTFNDGKMTLSALGDGTPITIGDTTYPTTAEDRFDARVKVPDVTPYLGIGWGHHGTGGPGWSFLFDLGVSVGRATVSTSAQGPFLGQVSQEDLDAETRELRDGVGRIRVLPQATVGVAYRF